MIIKKIPYNNQISIDDLYVIIFIYLFILFLYILNKFLNFLIQEITRLPEMISQTPFARVWFKQDDEYKLPKAVVYTELFRYVLVVVCTCGRERELWCV